MTDTEIVTDYRNDPKLRNSFNRLTKLVFGLSFEEWYARGLWDDSYVCHSIVENGEIVSNVSATSMNLIVDGQPRRAIQIGTVMTHPDHRKKGLADRLMRAVVEKYEDSVDFIYLFPNDTVMDFYPRYGFVRGLEYSFSAPVKVRPDHRSRLTRVNIDDDVELAQLHAAVKRRVPVSKRFDTSGCTSIYMWHCLFGHRNDVYRIGGSNSYVVYRENPAGNVLYDIIEDRRIEPGELLCRCDEGDAGRLRIHFTPDGDQIDGAPLDSRPNEDIFLRPFTLFGDTRISHPAMAMT